MIRIFLLNVLVFTYLTLLSFFKTHINSWKWDLRSRTHLRHGSSAEFRIRADDLPIASTEAEPAGTTHTNRHYRDTSAVMVKHYRADRRCLWLQGLVPSWNSPRPATLWHRLDLATPPRKTSGQAPWDPAPRTAPHSCRWARWSRKPGPAALEGTGVRSVRGIH